MENDRKPDQPETKKCPACGETIRADARKCRFCGEFFITCARCGHETAKGFAVCHFCGLRTLPQAQPPAAEPPVAQADIFALPAPPAAPLAPMLPPGVSPSHQRGPQQQGGRQQASQAHQPPAPQPQGYSPQYEQQVTDAVRKGVDASRSFVGIAFATWILYYVGLYIVGLIMNLAYLSSANRIKRQTGTSPSGRGCLIALIIVHFFVPALAFAVLAFVVPGEMLKLVNSAGNWCKEFMRHLR